MSTAAASGKIAAAASGPSLRTKVAAVAVVLALAGLAAYALFSGPTVVWVPSTSAPKSTPSKAAPPGEDQFPESGEGGERG